MMSEKRAHNADLSTLRINRESEQPPSSGKKSKIFLFMAPVALLLVLALYFALSGKPSAKPVRLASATRVYPSQSSAILTASGYVVAQRQAAIASKGTGRLQYLGFEEGDQVKEGQIIGQLEHDDVDAAKAQAAANLQMALASLAQRQAELHEAKLNFDRQKELVGKKLISDSEYEIAEARFKSTEAVVAAGQAQVEQARAAVASADVEVENTLIRAPFDGTVLTKNADIGEMVAPFAASSNSRGAVVTMADMTSLEVEADVSESNIQRVRRGQACEIVLDAFPEIRYPGYVHKIVPTADRAKATVLTKIRFNKLDEKVLPEMSAKVNFLASDAEPDQVGEEAVLTVPKSAVIQRNQLEIVLVVRDGIVTETPVVIGREIGNLLEVTRGLSTGDQVVLEPMDDLVSGSKIVISD